MKAAAQGIPQVVSKEGEDVKNNPPKKIKVEEDEQHEGTLR